MPADPLDPPPGLQPSLFPEGADFWDSDLAASERHSLVDLVNRVLDRGVVISGDIVISVAGVDLVYLGLNAVLTSVTTARRIMEGRVEIGGGEPLLREGGAAAGEAPGG